MIRQIVLSIFVLFLFINNGQSTSITKRSHQAYQLIKETKERVKHGIQCLSPSKYFAGSCYTYMKTAPAPSWERAYNNCLSLPKAKDARLLSIESIDEYEFIERELIGLKSGSDSVSVYIGLRKINNTWFWLNDVPLKETLVYRRWADNNRDILAYDCGILWFARNTSVITPAPCVEQALRPYVCKQTIDRCYNNSASCGKYGTCINLPLTNTFKCQCRFLYTGDQCEKWSSQGLQIIIGAIIVFIAFIISYIINMDRSEDSWSFRKSTQEQSQTILLSGQNSIAQSSKIIDHMNSFTSNKKHSWSSSHESIYSFNFRYLFIKPKNLILILLPITLTIIISVIIINAKNYIKQTMNHSTQLFEFCILYENNYYHNLLTLPIALVIILLIIINQTRKEYYRLNKEKFSIYIPLPFNPFSKINRFDNMILCGIISYEILEIIKEIFLKTTQMKLLTINGPLFELIRQIGLIIIVALRYYPVYSIIEMANTNILYYTLCSLYMWLDLCLRIFEQAFCINMKPLIQIWQKFEQFKNQLITKYESNALISSTTTMLMPEYDDARSGGFRNRIHRFKDRFVYRGTKLTTTATTTMTSTIHPFSMYESSVIPINSLNWSSIDLNNSLYIHSNDSLSTFDQFGIDSSTVSVLKYAPYYLCLTYICCRLTYLLISNVYHSFICCNNENSIKKPLKHIYHEPTFTSNKNHSIEYYYVHDLFQKLDYNKKSSLIQSLLNKIYQPKRYFHYSKQILNMYMIAFMLIYYLTFNMLENGFNLIEKIYNFTLLPLLIVYDELDLPEPKLINLKYEMIFTCLLTSIIYFGQLFFGMKHYQKHMLNAYKGIFINIPARSAFKTARLMSKNIHYPGYCIAYLIFGYIIIGNLVFFILIALRILFKHVFLIEEIAKVLIPILVIYLMKFIIQWFLSRTFFLQKHGKIMVLKNLRVYFVFTYFNFFFDCFLGLISCAFRILKAWIVTFVFLPRLDYCIHGRALEKLDIGFISYVSFIHMECLHTHPVLVYFCSIINEQIEKRYQYLRISKRDIYLYTNHQRIIFRWWLAITLNRNMRLIQLRKHYIKPVQLSSVDSFMNHFQNHTILTKNQEKIESNVIIRNHTTTCTTLLLDVDEHDDRKLSF
ncbi:unnamed protein product [Adineta steineri]|uniref:EGF-like domain-containing protein n=2 Tax=Adineta steineri TaxID=433720 RepID=A0A815G3Z5_9BILA|nr:unnamed protein product [Adineta steineri]CAF3658805.1 unnamed protein product [Adineta steineri]